MDTYIVIFECLIRVYGHLFETIHLSYSLVGSDEKVPRIDLEKTEYQITSSSALEDV